MTELQTFMVPCMPFAVQSDRAIAGGASGVRASRLSRHVPLCDRPAADDVAAALTGNQGELKMIRATTAVATLARAGLLAFRRGAARRRFGPIWRQLDLVAAARRAVAALLLVSRPDSGRAVDAGRGVARRRLSRRPERRTGQRLARHRAAVDAGTRPGRRDAGAPRRAATHTTAPIITGVIDDCAPRSPKDCTRVSSRPRSPLARRRSGRRRWPARPRATPLSSPRSPPCPGWSTARRRASPISSAPSSPPIRERRRNRPRCWRSPQPTRPCVPAGSTLSIDPKLMRFLFAEALYRWSVVQRDGPTSPWAAH